MVSREKQRGAVSSKAPYYDLGSFHRPITTKSSDSQMWFDRGLIWSYAFNHEEAVECFEQAILHDATCVMAYWGIAYALGPNYNKPWEVFDEGELGASSVRMRHAAVQAAANAVYASSVEKALVRALRHRCPSEDAGEDFSIWNQSCANAMELVYRNHPEDLDVAALYADSLMNLTPWQLWDLSTGKPAQGARTLEAKEVLDLALTRVDALKHPGLLHLYIHLMEMSSTPEAALPVANHLRGLVPDAGHLHHMPTHLDILCGDYQRAITSNSAAITADEKFLARSGPLNFYTIYRVHNYHFRIYAAMFSGQFGTALDTVEQLEASIPEELLRVESPPMADWLEGFAATRVHVLVRFGRWQDIINLPLPQDAELYCVTTAILHYGRGISSAVLGQIDDAEKEHSLFRDAVQRVPPTRTLFNNKCTDILAIANAMLTGELEYRRGNFDIGIGHLQQAITLDDALPYDEPWGWMQPTRHAYGALLLEQGHVERAAAVYRADLGLDDTLPRALQHPSNVFALHGYHECLVKLGRTDESKAVRQALDLAITGADVVITSSCFCRLNVEHVQDCEEGCSSEDG